MSDDVSRSESASGFPDDAAIPYTVVETAQGFLYLMRIASTGRLFYDPQTIAPTADEAAAALRRAIGGDHFRHLTYESPARMLQRIMEIRIGDEDGG